MLVAVALLTRGDNDGEGVLDGISTYHMPLVKFCCPVIIALSFLMIYTVGLVRAMMQSLSQICSRDNSDDDFLPAGLNSGKGSSHTCVECMCAPFS